MEGLGLDVLEIRGRPMIFDPNYIMAANDDDSGEVLFLNTDYFMPATVERTINVETGGKKELVKTWLGFVNPMKRTSALAKTFVKDTELYFTLVVKGLNKQGLLSVTSTK